MQTCDGEESICGEKEIVFTGKMNLELKKRTMKIFMECNTVYCRRGR